MTATDQATHMAIVAAEAAAAKLATDINIIDVSDRLAITDCFVLASGANERQIGAIVESISERMRADGHTPVRREGERDGHWVLLDFVDVVVHVQHTEQRVYYALDQLWKDCPTIPFDGGRPDGGDAGAGGDGVGDAVGDDGVGDAAGGDGAESGGRE